ncbi:fibronectin type III domain-containing protein [Jiangella anatolica]|uniref:Fibronectin type-III domain-containing protein n=1 Tax=Jiangella anatolica TaxID=2670374 RepID=A0A2W2C948_9ACTN|nr:fibronectin type III domain-containing protein [Jiangella anatolica]PZF82336.1 hypothetical protein C1I92_17055 [Jiangella anatolica]
MSTTTRRRMITGAISAMVTLAALAAPAIPAAAAGDTSPPTVPANVRVANLWGTAVEVAWDPSTDDSANPSYPYYEIMIDTPDPWTATTARPTRTQRFDGLGAGVRYTVSVRAVDGSGNRSAWNSVTFTTPGPNPPSPPPTNLRAVLVNGVVDAIAWDAPLGQEGGSNSATIYSGPNVVAVATGGRISVRELLFEWCLEPGQYTFTVQADAGHSQPLTVTLPSL